MLVALVIREVIVINVEIVVIVMMVILPIIGYAAYLGPRMFTLCKEHD